MVKKQLKSLSKELALLVKNVPEEEIDNYQFDLSPIQPKRFTVVGESHPSKTIGKFVEKLLTEKPFDNLFLEGLLRGFYQEEGDNLKDRNSTYGFCPKKYDSLIKTAIEKNIKVYGLRSKKETGKHEMVSEWNEIEECKEVEEWARYILENAGNLNLILVGAGHVNYWQEEKGKEKSILLPAMLYKSGIKEEDILTITQVKIEHDDDHIPYGLYKYNELPDIGVWEYMKTNHIADFVLVTPSYFWAPLL